MSVLITIGDFSRMTHLSIKTLRHYHDVGLLEPVDVDRSSGYRFYDPGQVPVAEVIRKFRDLGMPVDEVRAMLQAPDVETRNKVIIAHLERMESQLADTAATVTSLRSMLEGPGLERDVELRFVEATPAVAITDTVTMDGFVAWWFGAFTRLREMVAEAGLERSGPDGALYSDELFEEEVGNVTAFIPVAADAGTILIPAAELAVMVHEGSLDDLVSTYSALGTAVATRVMGVDGPIREYYPVSPLDGADEASWRTEVGWPVLRSAG
jgi:DNA-binding transcriptional MerR regulator/effector-binding domain-containing protein